MRQCKFRSDENQNIWYHILGSKEKLKTLYYNINNINNLPTGMPNSYPYHIYETINGSCKGTYSKIQFDNLFIDTKQERIDKLKKLNIL